MDTTKKCTKCGGAGPFGKDSAARDGLKYRCSACLNEYNRGYRSSHIQEHRERVNKWKAAHPERTREYVREWTARNPEYVIQRIRNYRARKMSAAGSFTAREWEALKDSYASRCAYCNTTPKALTADHIVPLALGGTNYIDNIVPACQQCNSSKGDRPLLVWMWRNRTEAMKEAR